MKLTITVFEELRKQGYYSYLCALLAMVILPLHVKFLPPVMILWAIFWIIENYDRTGEFKLINKHYKYLFFSFLLYYSWQLIGLLYTADIEMGLSNLFGRLSLIIFPTVLIFPGETIKAKINQLLKVFALSAMVYLIFCYLYALYRSVNVESGILIFNPHPEEFWLNYFYGEELLLKIHPSYFSLYTLLAFFISLESFFASENSVKQKFFWLLVSVFFIISIYLISSRAGIIAGIISIPVYLIIKLRHLRKSKHSWIFIVLIVLIIIPLVLKNQRMDYFFGKLLNTKVNYERKDDPRILIWKSSFNLIKENFVLGVGIGDVRTELTKKYLSIGEEKLAEERLNAHNQFLEVLIENGIIGFIIFLCMLFLILRISFVRKNLLLLSFLILIIVFFTFETVLYRLAGVTFFSIFSGLVIHKK